MQSSNTKAAYNDRDRTAWSGTFRFLQAQDMNAGRHTEALLPDELTWLGIPTLVVPAALMDRTASMAHCRVAATGSYIDLYSSLAFPFGTSQLKTADFPM